ncbi:hypothetical protein DAPPUDRAFT_239124 [Daphnia pulex]|uniref:Uncharacterized protein n=1 Tax=Daphnia pulex TaxID=6669 RepID=E9G8E4_DAPPU|nr:hypothetical protein DAPPUDRAFT_239124 [Daphnia pulex]|eukprot:EFX84284.1 hypothetical protein DAPPUDRAFT_239124 [Daphnia pulex]
MASARHRHFLATKIIPRPVMQVVVHKDRTPDLTVLEVTDLYISSYQHPYHLESASMAGKFPIHSCDITIVPTSSRNEGLMPNVEDVNTVAYADETLQILFSGTDDGLLKVWARRTLAEKGPWLTDLGSWTGVGMTDV